MEVAAKIAASAVGIYLAVLAGMYLLQRSLMYHPAQDLPTPEAAGAPEMSGVRLKTDDGLELVAWYKPAAEKNGPEIIYFHGNGGHIGHRAAKLKTFTDAGYGLLLVSYRGYGGNPGTPSEEGLFADGRAAYDFLVSRGVAAKRIAVIGESLGSGVAVYVASEREVALVMLEAPFTSAADVGQKAYPIFPVTLLIKDRFDSLSRIRSIDAPLLIVHGESDRVVPISFGRRLFDAAAEPKEAHFLADALHNDLELHGLLKFELDFLQRQFGG